MTFNEDTGKLMAGLLEAKVSLDPTPPKRQELKEKIRNYLKDPELDILVAPEYFFYFGKPCTREEFENDLEELVDMSSGKHTLLMPGTFMWDDGNGNVYNTLPIICDGNVILNYDKRTNGGEREILDDRFNKTYAPGVKPGRFECKNLRMGVELCSDHSYATLRNEGTDDLDLQLLVAAGKGLNWKKLALKEEGYLLRCDGYQPETEVWRKNKPGGGHWQKNGDWSKVRPSKIENGELYVYELDFG